MQNKANFMSFESQKAAKLTFYFSVLVILWVEFQND